MTNKDFIKLALSFADSQAAPHFDRTAFKIMHKRIFATLHEVSASVNLKLSPADQSVYCLIDPKSIYPVNNKWGLQGWTTFKLVAIDTAIMVEALQAAYKEAMTKRPNRTNEQ